MSSPDPEIPQRFPAGVPSAAEAAAEAALAAQVAALYAQAPGPATDAAARCAAQVLSRAQRARAPWLRVPWWGGAAAAAALLLVVSMRQELRHRAATALGRRPAPAAEPGTAARVPSVPSADGGGGLVTHFAVTLPPGAHTVTLVGDFNGWNPTATPMHPDPSGGTWEAAVQLPPGRHVYAFVVDGAEWRVDPLAPQVPDNGLGPANAVIVDQPR